MTTIEQVNETIVKILSKESHRQGGTPLQELIEILRWEVVNGEGLDVDYYEPEKDTSANITNTTIENEVLQEYGLDPSLLFISFRHEDRDKLVAEMYGTIEDEIEEEDNSNSVYTVQLIYTSPTGYSEDRNTTVAAFSTEDRARLFVTWANRECKNIGDAYLKLRESVDHTTALKKLSIPHPLNQIFPEDDWGTRRHHFQYGEAFDLDPMFG